jgi:hypothetical protein
MIIKLRLRTALLGVTAALAAMGAASADPAPAGKTAIGLVLTTWVPAFHETAGATDECPAGFQHTNRENWSKQYPSQEQQSKITQSYVHLGPNAPGGPIPDLYLQNRGPNGENVTYNPTLVQDALPLLEVQSKVAYGLNLDGSADGHATPNTCAHQKFVSPDGEPGIDNQLYRVIGCAPGWRKGGFNVSYHAGQFIEHNLNRILIEVSGVDNEQNDEHVDVAVYKGIDRIDFDASGKPLPWLTQRIDIRYPRYMAHTHGKIVNGVLQTDPVDMRFPLYQMNAEEERLVRGMRLNLKLTDNGAEGLVAGYEDLREWWRGIRNSYVDVVDSIGLWSPPAMYEAAHRLADGYPDPKTGQCTSISAAYKVTAVRAYIIQPPPNDPLLVDPVVAETGQKVPQTAADRR